MFEYFAEEVRAQTSIRDYLEGEVAAKLEEAREQLRQYAGDGRHAQAKGHTTLRYIAVVYRAWELAALEEVVL